MILTFLDIQVAKVFQVSRISAQPWKQKYKKKPPDGGVLCHEVVVARNFVPAVASNKKLDKARVRWVCRWGEGSHMLSLGCAYLDLFFVCQISAEIHQQKPTKMQDFFISRRSMYTKRQTEESHTNQSLAGEV